MTPHTLDPALSSVALDLLEQVLSHGDRPGQAARALCDRVRAMTRARLVAVIEHDGRGGDFSITVEPDHRRGMLEADAAARLLAAAREAGSMAVWTTSDDDTVAGALREASMSDCRVVPLVAGRSRVGTLLIVDADPRAHIEPITRAMGTMSKVLALMLRNASFQREAERLIDERTGELRTANETLRVTQERYRGLNADLERRVVERTRALADMNSELVALNRRLASTVRELEESNLLLDEATRAKSLFLANMSHELRTPMNSIIGFSGILLKDMAGPISEEQRRQIGMVNTAGRHLLELINEVLDLSRIEAGHLDLSLEYLDPVAVAEKVAASMRPTAADRRLRLSMTAESECGRIHSDPLRLEQILLNLVGNAIKFTEDGDVRLRVAREDDVCVFEVADTGKGIPNEELEKIFDEFYQLPAVDVAKHAGTGLGLSISRRLADMLGGTLHATSTVGDGSTFTLRVPVRSASAAIAPLPASA